MMQRGYTLILRLDCAMTQAKHQKLIDLIERVTMPLILVSVISLAVSSELEPDTAWSSALLQLNFALVLVFCVEYCIRLYLGRGRYAISFLGVIDLLASLPCMILLIAAGTHDPVALRLLRVFQFVRLLKMKRYARALARLGSAFVQIKDELAVLGATSVVIVCISAFGIRYFERHAQPEAFATFWDALWWAVITLTTVGYGDVYPITTGGKVFASVLVFVSLAIVAAPAGLLASALSRRSDKDRA